MRPGSNQQAGFTLVELMITLLISAIMLGIAVPYMGDTVAKQQVFGEYKSIRNVLTEAKNGGQTLGALKKAGSTTVVGAVVICPGTEAGCAGTDWSDGFIAFGDLDGDGDYTAADSLLAVQDELSRNSTLVVTDQNSGGIGVDKIALTRMGYTAEPSAGSAPIYLFTFCNSAGDEKIAKGVVYGAGGIIRMTYDTDDDGIPNYGVANLSCP